MRAGRLFTSFPRAERTVTEHAHSIAGDEPPCLSTLPASGASEPASPASAGEPCSSCDPVPAHMQTPWHIGAAAFTAAVAASLDVESAKRPTLSAASLPCQAPSSGRPQQELRTACRWTSMTPTRTVWRSRYRSWQATAGRHPFWVHREEAYGVLLPFLVLRSQPAVAHHHRV